jgi:hypothetical protein
LSDEEARGLAEKLAAYARTLPEGERYALCEMLLGAMEPLDRFRYLPTSDLLSSEEEAVLRALEKHPRRG